MLRAFRVGFGFRALGFKVFRVEFFRGLGFVGLRAFRVVFGC